MLIDIEIRDVIDQETFDKIEAALDNLLDEGVSFEYWFVDRETGVTTEVVPVGRLLR